MSTVTKSLVSFLGKECRTYNIDGINYLSIYSIFPIPKDEEKAWKCIEKIDSKDKKHINPLTLDIYVYDTKDIHVYDVEPRNCDIDLVVSWESLLERLTK